MKKWLRIVLKWAVTLAVTIGALVLGLAFEGKIPNAAMWHCIAFLALLAAEILSPVLSIVWSKKLGKAKAAELVAIRDRRLDRMDADAQRELRRLRLAVALSVAYLILVIGLALAVCFFSGVSGNGVGSTTSIAGFFLFGVVSRFLRKRQEKPDFSMALPRKDFPLLYGMMEEAAGALAKKNRIYIFVSDDLPDAEGNVGIALCIQPLTICAGAHIGQIGQVQG